MPQHDPHRVETTAWLDLFARYQDRVAAWTMLIARLDDEIGNSAPSCRRALCDRRTSLRAKRDATVQDLVDKSGVYLTWLDAELESIRADAAAAGSSPEGQERMAGWAADLRRDWNEAHRALQASAERYIGTLDAEIGRMQLEVAAADSDNSHHREIAALHAHQQDTWRRLKDFYEEFRRRRETAADAVLFAPGSGSGDRLSLI